LQSQHLPSAAHAAAPKVQAPECLSTADYMGSNLLQSAQAGAENHSKDNFVLEWAYSFDQDEWKNLEDKVADDDWKQLEKVEPEDLESAIDTPTELELPVIPDAGGGKRRANQEPDRDQGGGGKKKVKIWRKYGEKLLKGNQFLGMEITRCYFRCNVKGCSVKKQVEKAAWQTDEEADVTVTGVHSHPPCESVEESVQTEKAAPAAGTASPATLPPNHSAGGLDRELKIPPLNKELSNEIHASSPHFVISDARQQNWPIIFASPGFCRFTGYTLGECIGKDWRFLHGKNSSPLAVEQIATGCRLAKEIRIILLNYKKNGEPFWNYVHTTPVKDLEGNLVSYVSIQMDVSLHDSEA